MPRGSWVRGPRKGTRKGVQQYHAKSPKDRSSWDGSDDSDYIKTPKPDGYRSVHLIFRFRSPSPERKSFNGQRIEIQIRSKLQHLWATAVETAQVFTGQALKSRVKHASEEWLRFFALTSSAFAIREKSPAVPGTPQTREQLIKELRDIVNQGNIMQSLEGWNDTIHMLLDKDGDVRDAVDADSVQNEIGVDDFRLTSEVQETDSDADAYAPQDTYAFLLILDPAKHTLKVRSFSKVESGNAQKEYEKAEKETESNPDVQVVLVSVESLNALPEAYPNYYVDTKEFIAAVNKEIDGVL